MAKLHLYLSEPLPEFYQSGNPQFRDDIGDRPATTRRPIIGAYRRPAAQQLPPDNFRRPVFRQCFNPPNGSKAELPSSVLERLLVHATVPVFQILPILPHDRLHLSSSSRWITVSLE